MAANDSGDIYLKILGHDGRHVMGEAQAVGRKGGGGILDWLGLVTGDNLFAGFKPEYMFEIESFKLAVAISDDDGEKGKNGAKDAKDAKDGQDAIREVLLKMCQSADPKVAAFAERKLAKKSEEAHKDFKAFRNGGKYKYPVSVQPISVTRSIDQSSPTLLDRLIATESFAKATVVKRKAAGTATAGEPYLRMDFVGVLLTGVQWSNSEPIKETLTFISRAITIRYKPQLPDGRLGPVKIGHWTMVPGLTEAPMDDNVFMSMLSMLAMRF